MANNDGPEGLAAALAKRKGGVGRGFPPLALYWILRSHGDTLAGEVHAGHSYRSCRKTLGNAASLMSIRTAVQRMTDVEVFEAVGSKNWDKLADLLFVAFPGYRSMEFFLRYIAPGEEGRKAWLASLAASKRRGRKTGSKNLKRRSVPAAKPAPETGGGEGGSSAPVLAPQASPRNNSATEVARGLKPQSL